MEKLKELLLAHLGYAGKIISGSKSGYSNRNPNNLPVFNSNLCTDKKPYKAWHGDIDITISRNTLREIAIEANQNIYVLREMDARFGNEQDPKLDRFVYCAKSDGTEQLGEFETNYYELKETLIRKQK